MISSSSKCSISSTLSSGAEIIKFPQSYQMISQVPGVYRMMDFIVQHRKNLAFHILRSGSGKVPDQILFLCGILKLSGNLGIRIIWQEKLCIRIGRRKEFSP